MVGAARVSERLSSAWSGAPQARIQREERTRTVVQAVAAACSVTPSGVSAPSSSFCCRGPQRTSAGEAARAAVGVPPEDTKPAGASASGQCSAGNTHGQPRSLACWKPRPKPRKRGQSPRTGQSVGEPRHPLDGRLLRVTLRRRSGPWGETQNTRVRLD